MALALVIAAAVIWHDRLAADFWPIDASRVGPNLLASVIQWAMLLILVVLLYPPARRAVHRFVDHKLQGGADELESLRASVLQLHDKHEETQALVKKLTAEHARLTRVITGRGADEV